MANSLLKTMAVDGTSMDTISINVIYPVGSYYWTSSSTFDPNVTWGGTWELLPEGTYLQAAGSNFPVTSDPVDGGEAKVTLRAAEVPAHKHMAYETDRGMKFMTTKSDIVVNPNKRQFAAQVTSGGTHYVLCGEGTNGIAEYTYSGTQGYTSYEAHNNLPPYKNAYCWHRIA